MNEMTLNLAHYSRKYNFEILSESSSYETSMKNLLHTSKGMPSAEGMIIKRVPSGKNKQL